MSRLKLADFAAYLLDRADQYETDSPCWTALADAAHNIMLGEVDAAVRSGELDSDLYARLAQMSGVARPVVPSAGVGDEECP